MKLKQPVLVIFDRGYPAIELVDFLESGGIHDLFYLSSNDYLEERTKRKKTDEIVLLKHTYKRLAKIHKKHPERYEHMKEKRKTQVRISVSELPCGKEVVLMKKKYHTIKNKMKFESVTGKSYVYVYQDFWAQILICSMI